MLRKCVVSLAVISMAALLPARVALCDEGPDKAPPASGDRWDDDGPLAGHAGQVAFLQGDDVGPGGPPPKRGRGPGDDRGPGMGPPRDGERDRMPPPERGERFGPEPRRPGGPMGMGPLPPELKHDPEMQELIQKDRQLERESHELSMQYRRASTQRRDSIKKEVEELASKQFDVRQQRRSLELKRLEEELQHVREAVARREKARKELIDRRVSELLRIDTEPEF
jgi:hypothetical protein